MKSWILTVKEFEDGDQYIEFPTEVLEEAGWKEGDVLKWTDRGDGTWSLKKLDNNHENTEASGEQK